MLWKCANYHYANSMTETTHYNWQEKAVCARVDPEIFFKGDVKIETENTRKANQSCGACAVRAACLKDAFSNDERWGVWGGMTTHERKAHKRRVLRNDGSGV